MKILPATILLLSHLTVSAEVLDLGTLGGDSSWALDINDANQVVGYSRTADGHYRAFLWADGVMTDLGALGSGDSFAHAINGLGQVIGTSYSEYGHSYASAVAWQGGVITDISGPLSGSSHPAAINNVGQIVGVNLDSNSADRCVVWDGGQVVALVTLGGYLCSLRDINDAGQAVGWGHTQFGVGAAHAFLWNSGGITDLHPEGAVASEAIGISESGAAVGGYSTSSYTSHPVLWFGGQMTDLGSLGGNHGYAAFVNNALQVAGNSQVADGLGYHAFFWQNGVMSDLGTLGGPSSWTHDLNEAGQVVGSAQTRDGEYRAVVWENGVIRDLGIHGVYSEATAINQAGVIVGRFLLAPPDPLQKIEELISNVLALNLEAGISNSLDSKLQNARDALGRAREGDVTAATHMLEACMGSIEAQRGKKLTDQQADELLDSARYIIALLGQPQAASTWHAFLYRP